MAAVRALRDQAELVTSGKLTLLIPPTREELEGGAASGNQRQAKRGPMGRGNDSGTSDSSLPMPPGMASGDDKEPDFDA